MNTRVKAFWEGVFPETEKHKKSNNGTGKLSVPQPGKNMKEKAKTGNQMNIGWKSALVFIAAVLLCAFQGQTNVASAAKGSPKGAAGQMPAYYDGELFTVNMFEVPASDPIIAHNSSSNIIYATNDLDEEQDFVPVINAIQGD